MVNELTERLRKNYENQIKDKVEDLKKQGYILFMNINQNNNYQIYYYNADIEKFVFKSELYNSNELINIPNPYNFKLDNYISNLINKTLPKLNNVEINNYFNFMKNKSIIEQEKELKKELNQIKKQNKQLLKDCLNSGSNPEIEILYDNFIIYDCSQTFRRGFYIYKKNKFILLSYDDIEMLYKKNGFNNLNGYYLRDKLNKEFKESVVNSELPSKFIELEKAKNILKSCEKDYIKVKEVTDNFI